MKKLKFVPILVAFVLILGCANMGINLDTPEKKYLGARSEFNLLLKQYIQVQDTISDKDHKIAKEAFYSADKALDMWEFMLGDSSYDFSKDIQTWLTAKRVIMEILRKVM